MHCRLPRFASFPDLFVKGTLDDFLKMFFFWSKKIFSVFSKFNDRAGKFTTFGVVDQSVQLVSPHFLGLPNTSSFTFLGQVSDVRLRCSSSFHSHRVKSPHMKIKKKLLKPTWLCLLAPQVLYWIGGWVRHPRS